MRGRSGLVLKHLRGRDVRHSSHGPTHITHFRPACRGPSGLRAGTSWPGLRPDSQRAEVPDEPVSGQLSSSGQGPWLLEQVGGTGYHGEFVLALQLCLGIAVEVEHEAVQSSNDEQRRCSDSCEPPAG
jgi:hypothetical protein